MAAFVGMDPAAIRRVGTQLLTLADRLDAVVTTVQRVVDDALVAWEGQDGLDFSGAWSGQHRLLLAQSVAALQQLAAEATDQAAAQDTASRDSAGPFVGPVPPGALPPGGVPGAVPSGVPGSPPPVGGTPQENADWWSSLTPAQQAALVAEHPELVGNLDGIPGWARDQANRALLPVYRAELEAQKAHATGDEREIIQSKLAGLDAVEEALAQGNRQLLGLDITGEQQLKAIVAVGDVDTAEHIAVFTPGLKTTVATKLEGYDDDMLELYNKMGMMTNDSVATVSYLGYEAPQLDGSVLDVDLHGDSRSVASDDLAQQGAPGLADFYNGLNASHGGADNVHVTALGHSYGSLTTSLALQDGGAVDDAVFFGSPGLGLDQLSDLGLESGHAYYTETSDDYVADLAAFDGDPSDIDGIHRLSSEDSPFGSDSDGHGEYLTKDTTSQYNMAVIASGAHDGPVHAPLADADHEDGGLLESGFETARNKAGEIGSDLKDKAGDLKEKTGDLLGKVWPG